MNENKLYTESLNGFLTAVSIIKSPERNKLYGARFFENKSVNSELNELFPSDESEITILNKKNREVSLHWLYSEIENELSNLDKQVRLQLVDNIIYHFENLFDDADPKEVIEYNVFDKLIDSKIDYYCEFNTRFFLFQIQNDLLVLSLSDRKCPVRNIDILNSYE